MIGELEAIKRLLWEDWDPIGLNGFGSDDEYDSYAFRVFAMLNEGKEASEIAEFLRWAAVEKGLSEAGDCIAIARKVVEIHEGAP
jgi:hypothetical protein